MKRKKSKEESKTIHKESFIQGKKKKRVRVRESLRWGNFTQNILFDIFLEKSDTWMENQMRGNKVGKKYWK